MCKNMVCYAWGEIYPFGPLRPYGNDHFPNRYTLENNIYYKEL